MWLLYKYSDYMYIIKSKTTIMKGVISMDYKFDANNLMTDVYMKTEHQKKKPKAKVTFEVVINKVIVGALLLTSIVGSTTPAYAATTDAIKDSTAKINLSSTISQNYEISVENAIHNVRETISAIQEMKGRGVVNDSMLQQLANQIMELDRAVNLTGKEVTSEVVSTVLDAENVVSTLQTTSKSAGVAQAAIAVAKQSFGIKMDIGTKEIKPAKAIQLSDISTHWGKKDIEKLVSLGGISGYPDGTFKPDSTITRAEFLKIALLTVDNTIKADNSIDHWASGILNAAYELDIVREVEIPQTAEALNKNITRYEMSRIMVRINENLQKEKAVGITGVANIMKDYNSLPQTYRAYVEQAFMKGLIGGFPDSSFGGDQTGTRAQAATMVVRMIDKTARVKVDVNKPSTSIVNAKGQMTPEKSKEYSFKVFETARFYSEGSKYYLSVDLGTLPEGFKWIPMVGVYSNEGDYLYTTSNRKTIGLTGKQVFELEGITQSDIANKASARFSLKVITDKNLTSSAQFAIDSDMKGKAYENNVDEIKEFWFDYDTSKQFEGWK